MPPKREEKKKQQQQLRLPIVSMGNIMFAVEMQTRANLIWSKVVRNAVKKGMKFMLDENLHTIRLTSLEDKLKDQATQPVKIKHDRLTWADVHWGKINPKLDGKERHNRYVASAFFDIAEALAEHTANKDHQLFLLDHTEDYSNPVIYLTTKYVALPRNKLNITNVIPEDFPHTGPPRAPAQPAMAASPPPPPHQSSVLPVSPASISEDSESSPVVEKQTKKPRQRLDKQQQKERFERIGKRF